MLQGAVSRAMLCLSCCLLLWVHIQAEGVGPAPPEEDTGQPDVEDWELGSGSSPLHLFHSFPADSPFTTETPGKPVNCTQRFWLPPSSAAACLENMAQPEEFAKCRLLVLQNRAALQAVADTSGVEEGGSSYDHQARGEVQGIRSDHLDMEGTMQMMERVFVALEEKRREGTEEGIQRRMRELFSTARFTIGVRENMADNLEKLFSNLERSLLNAQLRLSKLIRQ